LPSEQPHLANLVKLNINESPLGPSPFALEAVRAAAADTLRLYPGPRRRSCARCSPNGAARLVKTFTDDWFWHIDSFSVEAAFGEGEHVAVFGRFTYTSTVLSRQVTSPFAVCAKVADGRCTYMQFMEDTLATSASFKKSGT